MDEIINRIRYVAATIKKVSDIPAVKSMAEEILILVETLEAQERNRWSNVKTDK
jgi:hypothetical protein